MVPKISFGQWLKQRRKTIDLTREELAQRIGCAAVTLYKIEVDERRPSKQIAELLASHLNIPAEAHSTFVRFARGEAAEYTVPWGTPFHPANNLPAHPTVLIGRDGDTVAIIKRLIQPELRLLTLIGPAGIGKTRLALEVASAVLDDFTEGVYFVSLSAIMEASLVLPSIANTLGMPDVGPRTPLERLIAFLHDKRTLLVLDNFEQILAAAAQIAALLTACPLLKVLVTSRAPLRIRQERQWPVPALAVPNLAQLSEIEAVRQYSAISLFVERAQMVKPDFSLTEENVSAVTAICTRLDGLPLAIELISARVKLLPPAALLERLHGRLLLQSDGMRDIEPRHRTLNAAIEWSYQLLSAEEQSLFRRLGVFVGGWTLAAAEEVCAGSLTLRILDGLASLLDKSLIKQEASFANEPRFMMLETVRAYALEKLAASGELDVIRQQHANYFAALKEVDVHSLVEVQGSWWDRLEVEHDNFRAALAWSRTQVSSENALRLALSLVTFWHLRGYLSEGIHWLTDLLSRYETGTLLTVTDTSLRARALDALATLHIFAGNLDSAIPLYEESLRLMRELDDRAGIIGVLQDYGMGFQFRGDYATSAAMLQEGLALAYELENAHLIGWSLFFLGTLAFTENQHAQAYRLWEDSLIQLQAVGNYWGIAITLANLAMKALDERDYAQARARLTESLRLLQELGEKWQIFHTLEGLACLAVTKTEPDFARAARIFGATEFFRQALSTPFLPYQSQFYERGMVALQAQSDAIALVAARAEGRAMTLDQVVAYALSNE